MYTANRGYNRYTYQQWLHYYRNEGAFNPYEWACWVCKVAPDAAACMRPPPDQDSRSVSSGDPWRN